MFEFEGRLTVRDRELREQKVAAYERQLREHPDIPAEHLKSRGFTGQVAQDLRIGFVHDPLPGDEGHRGRLVIPYLTRSGVTWIKTRTLPGGAQEQVKYTWITTGSGGRFYNTLDLLLPSPYVALVEGELDAGVASKLCGIPTVGMPGASSWRSEYRSLFMDYDTVFVVMDGDEPGRKAAGQVMGDLRQRGRDIRMPDGVDVNSLFVEHGRQAVRDLIGV